MAVLLRDRLTAKGYKVFLDIEDLNSGSFNTKLLDVIDGCKDVVVICSKGCLDRCVNDGDWVRTEIAYALQKDKNIVPIILRGFDFPEVLPDDIAPLSVRNAVIADRNEYFDAAIDRLANKFLTSKRRPPPEPARQSAPKPVAWEHTPQGQAALRSLKRRRTIGAAATFAVFVALFALFFVFKYYDWVEKKYYIEDSGLLIPLIVWFAPLIVGNVVAVIIGLVFDNDEYTWGVSIGLGILYTALNVVVEVMGGAGIADAIVYVIFFALLSAISLIPGFLIYGAVCLVRKIF